MRWSLIIRRSHDKASANPPARHQPLIAAMTGFQVLSGPQLESPEAFDGSASRLEADVAARLISSLCASGRTRSRPAQNARPEPVMTATCSASFCSNSDQNSSSCCDISGLIAFIRSGRSRVMVAILPSVSIRTDMAI